MGKLRLLAEVGAARHRVHGEARHLDLLAAVGIEVAHLGDGGCLTQEAQEIEATLLEPAARRQEAGRPADLPLDLLYELLDHGGCALRLLALHGDQRLAALVIGVVHLDGGADDQRAADQSRQQGGVLAEQAALLLPLLQRLGAGIGAHPPQRRRGLVAGRLLHAMAARQRRQHPPGRARQAPGGRRCLLRAGAQIRHSITSSARSSDAAGRSRPSALAALRLMISSSFVGCCTGMSPGLAPLRILSTRPAVRK